MISAAMLTELFGHQDWVRDQLRGPLTALAAPALDLPFEMGFGTIRHTLHHMIWAEWVWLARWSAEPVRGIDERSNESSPAELFAWADQVAAARTTFLQTGPALAQAITYTNTKGQGFTNPLGGLLLHAYNHGVHHRAQLVNMLRHAAPGAEQALRLDYIFWKIIASNGPTTLAPITTRDLQTYLRYDDWAQDRIDQVAATLPDTALEREYPMGLNTLRKTLWHIHAARRWWLENWSAGQPQQFPEDQPPATFAAYREAYLEFRARRDAFLRDKPDAFWSRDTISLRRRDGTVIDLRPGVGAIQLGGHGTYHRAQALNMLRQARAETPGLDLVLWLRSFPQGGVEGVL